MQAAGQPLPEGRLRRFRAARSRTKGTAVPGRDDGNPCTNDVCRDGQCTHPKKPNGPASNESGVCQDGTCSECKPGADCRPATCDGTTLHQEAICRNNGTCPDSEQLECDDDKPCTRNLCRNGKCSHPPRAEGVACFDNHDNIGTCQAGSCTPCAGRPCDATAPCCGEFECEDGFCGGCAERGFSCHETQPCCAGVDCINGDCGGCHARGVSCFPADQCCETDCTDGVCLSNKDGPCAEDHDCRACYTFGQCAGACANGSCTV